VLVLAGALLCAIEQISTFDFLTTVVLAIRSGFLKHGDFLLVDNACVHGGTATITQCGLKHLWQFQKLMYTK